MSAIEVAAARAVPFFAAYAACAAACSHPAPPAARLPRPTPTASEAPPAPPSMVSIDVALDDLARVCANAMTPDGDCVAPTALLCNAMEQTARACFDSSAEPTRCNVLMDAVAEHVQQRSLGPRTAKIVSTFCEATCEVRQGGHRWETARASLDAICARR